MTGRTAPGTTARPDALTRRRAFEAAHPEVTIVPPTVAWERWRAIVPAGKIPADPTATTLGSYALAGLMDQLDELYPPTGGNPGQEPVRAGR